jgi:hypothetical protein
MTRTASSAIEARRLRTVTWVLVLAATVLVFHGRGLIVCGMAISTFLRGPTPIGVVMPAIAGARAAAHLPGSL